ncbi:MAG: 50S ribosomal protein L2 [Verrucomicrobiota bacterium]|nr:50S ribosomal protein L2 [Verrucomicrobiota bacterium]
MALINKRPITPGQRFRTVNKAAYLSDKRPERSLVEFIAGTGGRNVYGRMTSRHSGGGHKRLYRQIDFRRNKHDIPATVASLEYDPNRTAHIALLNFADGEKRYILAPNGIKVGDTIINFSKIGEFKTGNSMPLRVIPPATFIHAIEMSPNTKAQLVRTAGTAAQLVGIDGDKATIKLPSGEIRLVNADCRATIGTIGNADHQNETLGKAGRARWKGRRPHVRGVAMNPVDHPNGGGQGKSKGGGGRQHLTSPWGQIAKGKPTRKRSKTTNNQIVVRASGRPLKK